MKKCCDWLGNSRGVRKKNLAVGTAALVTRNLAFWAFMYLWICIKTKMQDFLRSMQRFRPCSDAFSRRVENASVTRACGCRAAAAW